MVGQRRDDHAQRLRNDDEALHLPGAQPQRRGSLLLPARYRLDAAAHDLGDEGCGIERQPGEQRHELRLDGQPAFEVEAAQVRRVEAERYPEQQQSKQRQSRDQRKPGCGSRKRLPRFPLAAPRPAGKHHGPGDAAEQRNHKDRARAHLQHDAGQVHAAHVEMDATSQRERLLRHRHGAQHADVPDEQL